MMTKLLETPPLVNVAPLTAIQEVPIHLHHPIHPNSANKHKRLGLQMLNGLSHVEMFLARIETIGKHAETVAELARTVAQLEQALVTYESENETGVDTAGRVLLQRYIVRSGLAEMFPRSAESLGVDPVPSSGYMEAHLRQMSLTNQLVSIALQLQNDVRLPTHKYMAHQVALLYQCINQAGPVYARYKARVEEHFNALKELSVQSEEPQLSPELQTWLSDLTTDIVSEALFSGRPMSTHSEAAHLSAYIDRIGIPTA